MADGAPILSNHGCRLNAYEAHAVEAMARAAGSDAVIVNTCAVTAEAVRKARQDIRRLRCAHPVPQGLGGEGRCEDCANRGFAWRRARTATVYGGSSRQLVLSLKHGDRGEIARPMAAWMVRAGADLLARADTVVPVPLHWSRRLKRRMNQSAELSRRIARDRRIAHGPGLLVRTRATESQKGRSVAQRHRNMVGAFACPHPARVAGARIVLVDDVMTTGATANAAARVLRDAGAASVDVLVFARVVREGEDWS